MCIRDRPEAFGIKEEFPKNYAGQIVYPMLPETITNKINSYSRSNQNKLQDEKNTSPENKLIPEQQT